jgi:dipeptidyl aminopeptidase/acylaminoacyl peptidase
MTRSPRSDRPRAARPPSGRDPYGLLPAGTPIAAILSAVGLIVILVVSVSLLSGQLPLLGGANAANESLAPGATEDPRVLRTPTPSNIVVVPSEEPGLVIPGTIVYAKNGNIWLQSHGEATQLTDSGKDNMPTFSPDGKWVYFVRTRQTTGKWYVNGVLKGYDMDVPAIMRIAPSGGGTERILDGLVDPPDVRKWMGFIENPVVSPDGTTIAMASDLPDPTRSDVTLKLVNIRNGKITDPGLDQRPPLGHQDPAWRPDGQRIAYVRNDRDGANGQPRIYLYNPATGKAKAATVPGYLHPAWSPDGRYLAATKTSSFGTDVVILSASTGAELARITDDGSSWGPAWSPAGDQIAYLHVSGQVVDLRLAVLEGSAPSWTVADTVNLTTNAGLDSVSRPSWYIPPEEMPSPTPPPVTPSPAATPSPAGS